MIEVSITPTDSILEDLLSSLEMISSKFMPKTYKAFKMAASAIMYTWQAYAMGAPIPGSSMRIKNPTGAYARSIKMRMVSPFNYLISSDSEIARFLEDGSEALDMKKTHPFGKRSRIAKMDRKVKGEIVTKKGDPYLIIPFRHGIPNTRSYAPMPAQIYAKIRQKLHQGDIQLSQIIKGKKREPNYKGELIPRAKYKWGTRLTGTGIDELEGMVMMNVSTPSSVRSEYVSFRVISINSPAHKWIRPARPGMKITQHVVNNTQEIINEIITQGIKEDLGLSG